MLNPRDISEKRFEKGTFGYKPEEVDAFLNEVAESYTKIATIAHENETKIIKLHLLPH